MWLVRDFIFIIIAFYVVLHYVQSILFLYVLSFLLLGTSHVYSAFIFWLVVSFLIIYGDNRKQKKDYIKDEQNNYYKLPDSFTKSVAPTVIPNWTLDILQSLDSKTFMKLVAGYFEAMDFTIKYPTSIDNKMIDVFFLHKSDNNVPFAIIKCRAIGGDSVNLATLGILYDLSKQYGLINLSLVTTGDFSNELFDLVKNRKGFNLIRASQLISLLAKLPIEEQTYLFADMMLNKR